MDSPFFWLKREAAVLPRPLAEHRAGLTAVNGACWFLENKNYAAHNKKKHERSVLERA